MMITQVTEFFMGEALTNQNENRCMNSEQAKKQEIWSTEATSPSSSASKPSTKLKGSMEKCCAHAI